MAKVLCIGVAVADFVFYLPELPSKAEKYGTERAKIVGGGCAANASVAVSRLGGSAVLAGRLGDDAVGDMILADLAIESVDVSCVNRTEGGKSSYSSVLIDTNGERQVVNFRGSGLEMPTNWFSDLESVDAILADTRLVEPAIAGMREARVRGIPGVVDAEAPIDPLILKEASHIAFSMQGLRSMYCDFPVEAALSRVADEFGGWVCVTDGANGVSVLSENGFEHIPAFAVEALDTLAAGDVWHGAFALRLAEGATEGAAVQFANAAAALKCRKLGGRDGCPARGEVDELLKGEKTP